MAFFACSCSNASAGTSESTSGVVYCASVPLLHGPSIQSAMEAWSRRLAPRWAHATDSGDPERPVDQRLGHWVSWAGQVRMVRKLERIGWTPQGPRHCSRQTGYGRSTASVGVRPPVAATPRTKPGGLVTQDHGPANHLPSAVHPPVRIGPFVSLSSLFFSPFRFFFVF